MIVRGKSAFENELFGKQPMRKSPGSGLSKPDPRGKSAIARRDGVTLRDQVCSGHVAITCHVVAFKMEWFFEPQFSG